MTLLLTNMPIQPLATEFAVGVSTFPTAFDTVRSTTRALTEMFKIAMSELTYIYTKGDKTGGQTLVVENRNTRGSLTPYLIPLPSTQAGHLLKQDGGALLKQDGGYILLNQVEEVDFSNKALNGGMDVVFGKNLTNLVRARTYPRKVEGHGSG